MTIKPYAPKQLLMAALLLAAFAFTPAGAQPLQGDIQADMLLDATARTALIDNTVMQVRDNYVFPDLGLKVEAALRQHQRRGSYARLTSAKQLSELLTQHMQAVTRDKHLRIYYSEQPLPSQDKPGKPSAQEQAGRLAYLQSINYGVERVERLPFNIGYLDLRAFASAQAAAGALGAAMTLVAHTDALIIDLRNNGGGDAATVTLLAGYLLEGRTHLTNMYLRKGERTEQRWSADAVTGERFGHSKDVYVLTSKHTFSAAENFSFALQKLGRVTVVGETTGGGAHPGGMVRLHPHFDMFLPNGRAYHPADNTNWEGVGVAPDVAVKASEALKTAQLAVLRKMAARATNPDMLASLDARIATVQSEDTGER